MHDLLGRLGGAPGVARITDALYDRLLTDPATGPLFAATHLPDQRQRLTAYLVAACAGTVAVAAERLRVAHMAQGVHDGHVDRMLVHLADVLAEQHVDAAAGADLLALVESCRSHVVSGSLPSSGPSSVPSSGPARRHCEATVPGDIRD